MAAITDKIKGRLNKKTNPASTDAQLGSRIQKLDTNGDLLVTSAAAVDVSADSVYIVDASDSDSLKVESVADLADAMAAAGISGLVLEDSDASNSLTVSWSENDTSDRALDVKMNGADREISLSGDVDLGGDVTLSGTLTTSANVSFSGAVTVAGTLTTGGNLTFSGSDAVQFTTNGANTYTLPSSTGTLNLKGESVNDLAGYAYGSIYLSAQALDAETVTIDGRVYEFDPSDDGIASGDVEVDTSSSADVDGDITALASAINGDGSATVDAVADTTNDIVWLYAKTAGTAGNSQTLATDVTGATVSDSSLSGGSDTSETKQYTHQHTITAGEATIGFIQLKTGLTSINGVLVQHRTSAGVISNDIVATISGGYVLFDETGTNAWSTGDFIDILITGEE